MKGQTSRLLNETKVASGESGELPGLIYTENNPDKASLIKATCGAGQAPLDASARAASGDRELGGRFIGPGHRRDTEPWCPRRAPLRGATFRAPRRAAVAIDRVVP